VTFESLKSIEHKIYFMKKEHLAGVMFWELSEDPSGSLLNAIDSNIKRPLVDFKLGS
jgi:chitinase